MIVLQKTGDVFSTHLIPKPGTYGWIGIHTVNYMEQYLGPAVTN